MIPVFPVIPVIPVIPCQLQAPAAPRGMLPVPEDPWGHSKVKVVYSVLEDLIGAGAQGQALAD